MAVGNCPNRTPQPDPRDNKNNNVQSKGKAANEQAPKSKKSLKQALGSIFTERGQNKTNNKLGIVNSVVEEKFNEAFPTMTDTSPNVPVVKKDLEFLKGSASNIKKLFGAIKEYETTVQRIGSFAADKRYEEISKVANEIMDTTEKLNQSGFNFLEIHRDDILPSENIKTAKEKLFSAQAKYSNARLKYNLDYIKEQARISYTGIRNVANRSVEELTTGKELSISTKKLQKLVPDLFVLAGLNKNQGTNKQVNNSQQLTEKPKIKKPVKTSVENTSSPGYKLLRKGFNYTLRGTAAGIVSFLGINSGLPLMFDSIVDNHCDVTMPVLGTKVYNQNICTFDERYIQNQTQGLSPLNDDPYGLILIKRFNELESKKPREIAELIRSFDDNTREEDSVLPGLNLVETPIKLDSNETIPDLSIPSTNPFAYEPDQFSADLDLNDMVQEMGKEAKEQDYAKKVLVAFYQNTSNLQVIKEMLQEDRSKGAGIISN
ncbi:MAG: hypothetical protein MK033_04770 [Candidatus Caenarcaniphilales bacterium]|nr:hypothetical protein [Candidatus Caenarcaniphilales bacterium]